MKVLKFLIVTIGMLGVLGMASFFGLGIMSQGASAPGLVDGRLAPCPDSPNCVNSEEGTVSQASTEPLGLEAWEKLPAVITAQGGSVTKAGDDYISAEFSSAIFGFVDDVEFRKSDEAVHVRSASRVGYSDAGANAARVAALRADLSE